MFKDKFNIVKSFLYGYGLGFIIYESLKINDALCGRSLSEYLAQHTLANFLSDIFVFLLISHLTPLVIVLVASVWLHYKQTQTKDKRKSVALLILNFTLIIVSFWMFNTFLSFFGHPCIGDVTIDIHDLE